MRTPSLLVFVTLLGCSSTPPATFYSLPGAPLGTPSATDGVGLRVGPFTFPDYLRRPNVITRPSANRIEVAEFERWAGSLDNDFHRVLGSRLGTALATGRVSTYPAEIRFKPDYVIAGEVVTFDGTLGGQVTLDVHWVVLAANSGATLTAQHSVITEAIGGAGYPDLIDAHTRAIERLSVAVEAELRRLRAAGS